MEFLLEINKNICQRDIEICGSSPVLRYLKEV